MELTPIRRYYTTIQSNTRASVAGPLEFIKLALEDLQIEYIYLRRSLRIPAAIGASFQVQHVDIPHNITTSTGTKGGRQLHQHQWLVTKHVASVTPEDWEFSHLDKSNADRMRLASISQEMRILAHQPIQVHANVVDLIGFGWEKDKDELGRAWPYLIIENADCGSLTDFMNLTPELSADYSKLASSIALDIARGVEIIHSCGVIHGDLKPDNILVFEESSGKFCAKVSDFGSASLTPDLKSLGCEEINLPGFSPPWEAPEAYSTIQLLDLSKVDVYSFGLLYCYLVAHGGDVFSKYCVDPIEVVSKYDMEEILDLKREEQAMLEHIRSFLSPTCKPNDWNVITAVIEMTLRVDPDQRSSMKDISSFLIHEESSFPDNESPEQVPLMFEDDISSENLPEYEDIRRWSSDLLCLAASDMVISSYERSMAEIMGNEGETIERGAHRLFWLAKWGLSEGYGDLSIDKCLEWLLLAAEAGSLDARAIVYNTHRALNVQIPSNYKSSLKEWLEDACHHDEHPSQANLLELYPNDLSECVKTLRTIYCGYGQDCFGELWRNEFPLDYYQEWIVDSSETDINMLHDYPGLVCGLTWLHYASSQGRLDIVRYMVNRGSDPNVLNDYDETAFHMACQAGHYEVAKYLLPLTFRHRNAEQSLTELHFLDRFDAESIEDIADLMFTQEPDLTAKSSYMEQTPLAFILNRNAPNCIPAASALLRIGLDPLIKDQAGLDCLAHAACNLSSKQICLVLQYIPPELQNAAKADALWFLLEMDASEVYVRGGTNLKTNAEETLQLLLDHEVCQLFREMTNHSVFIVACAQAPVQIVQILLRLLAPVDVNATEPSSRDWGCPLMAAVLKNRPQVVELLLQNGAWPPSFVARDSWTTLFFAVTRSPKVTRMLLENVEVCKSHAAAVEFTNYRDSAGFTAFDIATAGEFWEAADAVHAYRPDFLAYSIRYASDSPCFYNMLGVFYYMSRQLTYLLDLVEDPSAIWIIDNENTSLLQAVAGGSIERTSPEEVEEVINAVLARFSSPEHANRQDDQGDTALHYAARFGNFIALKKLKEMHGDRLDWHAVNADGWSALDEACSREHQDVSNLGTLAKARFSERTKLVTDILLANSLSRTKETE